MKERKGSRGPFLSCSKYPACKGTRDLGGAAAAGPPKVAPPPVIGVPAGAQALWHVPPAAATLDSYQQAVADWREGFSVVSAAAGSGKSFTLVQRTLSLLREGYVPESICILVYNRDAAELLRNRLAEAAGPQAKRVQVFTFHAWCYALLRHWYPTDVRLAVGRIIGTSEAPHVAKLTAPLLSELNLDIEWGPASGCSERITEALVDLSGPSAAEGISRAMGWCKKGETFAAEHQAQAEPYLTFCRAWRDRKRRDNYIEFCDMLAEVARTIQATPDAPHVAHLAGMYHHVMVDEAQDISLPRAVIASHLAKRAKSSLWVGDARQCQPAETQVEVSGARFGATIQKVGIAEVQAGDRILSWACDDQCQARPRTAVVSAVASRLYTGTLYTVVLGKRQTRCTDTHKWSVLRGGLLLELPTSALRKGDRVPRYRDFTLYMEWCPIQVLSEDVVDLRVYSLDVEETHAYVADGIGTLNSIYLFTGARPDILLTAVSDGATLHTLPVNRRSTKRIVAAANAVCRGREWHVGGDCMARGDAPAGELVQVHVDPDPTREAARIIEDISRRVAAGRPLAPADDVTASNYCLLARTNAMLVDLECAFVARNIPVRVHGCSGGLWGTNVGQQLLGYLEAIEGVPSWGLMAVMNKPKRYCTRADVEGAIQGAQAAEASGQPADLYRRLKCSKGRGAQRLGEDLARAAAKPWQVRCATAAKWLGVDDEDDKVSGGEDRKAALLALVELAQQLGSLAAIYEYKVKATRGEKEPAVLLSTIHGSKGKEWPVVYVCGVRSRKLPHERCEDEEEELRLFYVACTRARDVLQIGTGGSPSKFLNDLEWATDTEGSMLTAEV